MKFAFRAAAAAALTLFGLCGPAAADPALGRVDTIYVAMSQFILVELTPGMRTHDYPLVADVRLRDASGRAGRRVYLRLDNEGVDAGDIVAVNQAGAPGALRAAPLANRDRLARIEAKHDTAFARNFFAEPAVLAQSRAE